MKFLRLLGRLVLALVGLVLILLIGVVAINLKDEDLTRDAQERIARVVPGEDPRASNGAYLLWAFDAPAGVDASALGHAVLDALAAVPPERVAQNDWTIRPPYTPQSFDFPVALACLDPNSACISQALAKPELLEAWVKAHAVLLERLAAIDSAPKWGALPQLEAANAPLPPVRPLIGTFSLSLDRAALEIERHHAAEGVALLEQDARIARRLLATSETVFMKSIAADLLRRTLLAYSEVLSTEQANAATVALLAASLDRVAADLSPAERSLAVPLDTEARRARNLALQVAHPSAGGGSGGSSVGSSGGALESLATRAAPLFFKPNATVNLEAELFDIEAPALDASPRAFATDVERIRGAFAARAADMGRPRFSSVYNPLGKIMAGYVPDLLDYAARVHDAQALMRAVRVQAWLMSHQVRFAQAKEVLDSMPSDRWDPYLERPFAWRAADAGIAVTQHSTRGVPFIKVPLT
jgi:hypothetical protein